MKSLVIAVGLFLSIGILNAQTPMKTTTYDNGEKKAEYFQASNGQIDVIFYFKSGEKKETGTYVQSKKHGEWVSYDREGNKTGLGYYDNGEKVSVWKFYDTDGNLTHEIDYSSGNGNLVMHEKK